MIDARLLVRELLKNGDEVHGLSPYCYYKCNNNKGTSQVIFYLFRFSGHRGVVRYHGVLAPRARNRDRIVPTQPVAESTAADRASSAPPCGHRLRWATLLARVFSTDRSACPAGGGRLRIIAALTDPDSIRTYLQGVGRPAVPPPRAPPLPRFEFAA